MTFKSVCKTTFEHATPTHSAWFKIYSTASGPNVSYKGTDTIFCLVHAASHATHSGWLIEYKPNVCEDVHPNAVIPAAIFVRTSSKSPYVLNSYFPGCPVRSSIERVPKRGLFGYFLNADSQISPSVLQSSSGNGNPVKSLCLCDAFR